MLQNRPRNRKPPAASDDSDQDSDEGSSADELSMAVLLELLGDEYTRSVLRAVADQPRSGTAVAERTSMSKPTAFRRLNRLAESGLVTVRQRIDTEQGHHHKVYEANLDTLDVDLDGLLDGLDS